MKPHAESLVSPTLTESDTVASHVPIPFSQFSDSNRAIRTLHELGWEDPASAADDFRRFVQVHGVEPCGAVESLTAKARLLCIGEMHDFAGRYMAAEIIAAAARGGARWLFIEVYDTRQVEIDSFLETGLHALLPVSAGGGSEIPMRFQLPYVTMLHAARMAGMKVIAMDRQGAGFDERNEHMASAICRIMDDPTERGVAVVGQLHLVPNCPLGDGVSLPNRVRQKWAQVNQSFASSRVVTVGRAVPDECREFSVWADVGGALEPRLVSTAGSPFSSLASATEHNTVFGGDFDYLFFYPADAVL
jgi:hypothetical protein